MRGYRDGEWIVPVLLALFTIVIGYLGHYVFTYEEVLRTQILDRWWVAETRVEYDVVRTSCVSKEDTIQCTNETTTYSRCEDRNRGRELPPVFPDPPCEVEPGDDVVRVDTYWIRYRKEDSTDDERKISRFYKSRWSQLSVGSYKEVTFDIFGNVRSVKE